MEQKSVILEQETLSVLELMGRMANMTHRCRSYKYEILSLIGRRYQTNLEPFPSKKPFFTWSPSAAFGPKGPRRNGNTAGGEMEGEKVLFFFSESPPTHEKNNGVFEPPKVIKWEESWIMFSFSLSLSETLGLVKTRGVQRTVFNQDNLLLFSNNQGTFFLLPLAEIQMNWH